MADQRALRDPASRRPRTGLRRRDDAGFTLVEMLVTIVVIGMLASMVTIGIAAMQRGSEADACGADARRIRAAEESYVLDNGLYGTEQQLLDANLLSDESTLHDITLIDGSYELVSTGECVGVPAT